MESHGDGIYFHKTRMESRRGETAKSMRETKTKMANREKCHEG
jgi:hypothetical protein